MELTEDQFVDMQSQHWARFYSICVQYQQVLCRAWQLDRIWLSEQVCECVEYAYAVRDSQAGGPVLEFHSLPSRGWPRASCAHVISVTKQDMVIPTKKGDCVLRFRRSGVVLVVRHGPCDL